MVGAAFCMALYNVWSKPFIARSDPLTFTVIAMLSGAVVLCSVASVRGGFRAAAQFDAAQWSTVLYLGFVGGALAFFLWGYALKRTTPTRVAISVTVNPMAASALGTLVLHEAITANMIIGLAAVLIGIVTATTGVGERRPPS
jgi:drug/metabolite transporter (DMT)-like permease